MIKAVIIDDEQLAREVIKKFLTGFTGIEVVEECSNGFEGIKAITTHQPQLIFLDIQMPKLTGFEMLELLDEKPIIIFSTAFDQYAIKAFELSAADYLLKPYSKARFEEAVIKALKKVDEEVDTEEVAEAVLDNRQSKEKLDRVVIKNGAKIIILAVDKIDYLQAQDDYVAVYSEGKKYLKQITMKYLEENLPEEFVRVHRSYIVHINQIDKIEAYSKDSYVAILKNADKVSVSRNGYHLLKELLGI